MDWDCVYRNDVYVEDIFQSLTFYEIIFFIFVEGNRFPGNRNYNERRLIQWISVGGGGTDIFCGTECFGAFWCSTIFGAYFQNKHKILGNF